IRGNKFLNLRIASRLGWRVPDTLLTNSFDDAQEFIGSCESKGTIYKVLSYYFDADGQTIFTSEITAKDLIARKDSLRIAPVQLQEKIAKKYELRVTVVGDEVFAAKISSQASLTTALDWRRDQGEGALYKSAELSATLTARVLS